MKAVLITGITGQDGSYLAEKLTNEKNTLVYGLMRRTSRNNLGALSHSTCNPDWTKLRILNGDLTDPVSLREVFNYIDNDFGEFPKEIYHMGAFTHVGESYKNPELCLKTNTFGTLNLLEIVREYCPDSLFYNAATSELFSGEAGTAPQNELTPMAPKTPYGTSKLAAYNLCNFYRDEYEMNISQGILFNHGSPRRGQDFVEMKIVRGLTRIALGLQPELILGNLEAKRDWGFAGDYMDAVISINRAADYTKPDNYVVGTGQTKSVKDLLNITSDILVDICESKVIPSEFVISNHPNLMRGQEVKVLQADLKKTVTKIGWLPKTNLEMLVKMIMMSELLSIAKEFPHKAVECNSFWSKLESSHDNNSPT